MSEGKADGSGRRAWALVVDRAALDVEGQAERFGTVFRVPLPEGAPLDHLAPGQPCVLHRVDRSRTVGIWAIGEVVAPALVLDDQAPALPGEADLVPPGAPAPPRRYAEVELRLLEKPIGRDRLATAPALAASALLDDGTGWGLVPLSLAELQAVEAMDFWLVEPDDDQLRRLDALLGAEDDLLA
ncbi:MAG: hypothetical protein U0P45_03740 [Acidimicrobiales bacterium]